MTELSTEQLSSSQSTPVFSGRVRAVVVTIAVVSVLATVVALVFGRRLAPPPAQPRDSYGYGALGHRAFFEAMGELGVGATRWTRPDWETVRSPLFIIEPNAPYVTIRGQDIELGELVARRSTAQRVTVIVLPKWQPGMLGMVEPESTWRIEAILDSLPHGFTLAGRAEGESATEWTHVTAHDDAGTARALELRSPQRIEGGAAVLADEHGAFVMHDGKNRTFVVSDPDLLHSFNLHRADHAAFWVDFAERRLQADSIVIDEVFHGATEVRSLAEVFGRWPGVLALLHLALVAITVLLMSRKRLGPPDAPGEPLGRGPREVIDVAASVLANGTRGSTLTARYVEDVIADLHRRLSLPSAKTLDRRAELVDEAATRRKVAVRAVALLSACRAIEGKRRAPNALKLARDAATFRQELLHPTKEP